MTAWSSGREVVEVKMLEKIKTEILKDGSIKPEQAGDIELPKEEKSNVWEHAMVFYAYATPLVIASPIMYLIFRQDMFKGEVCKLYELSIGMDTPDKDPQGTCLKNYDEHPHTFIVDSGFRYPVFLVSLTLPVVNLVFELCANQLMLVWKQISYQYIFTIFYMIVTAVWQFATQDAIIFPKRLDWICSVR